LSRVARAWWPVIAWMGVIVFLTSVRLPVGGLARTGLPLDKAAHVLLYGGLGWTLGRAMWVSGYRAALAVWLCLLAGLLFGAADEWHQGTLRFREASFSDWLADAAGVSLGLAAFLWPRWLGMKHAMRGEVLTGEASGSVYRSSPRL
jgi:VanZ family protein